jgi:hypothetical protein
VDSLWVLIMLLVAFCTIVTVRMFVNGSREEAGALEGLEPAETARVPSPAPPTADATRARSRSAAAPAATTHAPATATMTPEEPTTATPARRSRRAAASRAAAAPVWPGGDCPNCGSATVPSAKFCGECGHRLIP